MSPREPGPTPVPIPKDIPIKCPNCSTVTKVDLQKALLGFICPGCGQKVGGINPEKDTPDNPQNVEEEK